MDKDEGVNVYSSVSPEMLIKVLKELPCTTHGDEPI
jgi:hypothetical protein